MKASRAFQLKALLLAGNGVLLGSASLDGSRQMDRSAVEQELFGQGRLAGIRVRDDSERAAAFDLLG